VHVRICGLGGAPRKTNGRERPLSSLSKALESAVRLLQKTPHNSEKSLNFCDFERLERVSRALKRTWCSRYRVAQAASATISTERIAKAIR
jgi:hypothetical protein